MALFPVFGEDLAGFVPNSRRGCQVDTAAEVGCSAPGSGNHFFSNGPSGKEQSARISRKRIIMEQLRSFWNSRNGDNDDHRLLKRLRMALLFWLVSFIVTAIWFTTSPGF